MLVLVCFLYFQYICACYSYINKFMCIRMCVCVAYLQACIAIDSENKIKQQSPHHTHTQTHSHSLKRVHSPIARPSHSLSLSLLLFRTPAQWRQLSWIIAAGSFLQFAFRGGGGHFNRRRDATSTLTQQHTTSCSAALRTAEQRGAAQLLLAAAALSHFAFHILTQRTRLCPPPRAAFAVDFQCEMKSRGWWTCVRFHGSTFPPPQCIISEPVTQPSSASTDTCGTSRKPFAVICWKKM